VSALDASVKSVSYPASSSSSEEDEVSDGLEGILIQASVENVDENESET